ncbi:MAG TPA: hypothetical protein VE985_03805 [Gaiellaceae bacterium]|nr:hypothetical protein [Gaiellaceae bacterium]
MSGIARRLATLAALAALTLPAAASSTAAANRAQAAISGVVPHAGARLDGLHAAARAATANAGEFFLHEAPCSLSSNSPCWVMRRNTTYAIYWVPSGYSVDASYESGINQFLSDVAAASGSQTNVYSVATQYFDATGFVGYQSTFGGAYVDTNPFPTSGCDDSFHGARDSVCLTDGQLQTEIQNVVTAQGWQAGRNALFLLMTPKGVGSCFDSSSPDFGGQCTTNAFCAYHSGFSGTNSQPVLYANEPYDAGVSGCANGPTPNGDDADVEINTLSHEQNEAITDPWGNAWMDSGGDEIGDVCSWQFGTPLGTASNGQPYNQLINGHPYALQEEYSNDGDTCLASYIGRPANTARPALSGGTVLGQSLSASQGSWTQIPTGYAYQWLRCAENGRGCKAIPGATSTAYAIARADVGHTVEARVAATNARGTTTATSKPSAVAVDVPASRKAPRISGLAKVGGRLSAGKGAWSGAPQRYHYEWLRCNARGGSCVLIKHATRSTYRLTKQDAHHRLRVRVTALNAAGSRTATSHATARVPTR